MFDRKFDRMLDGIERDPLRMALVALVVLVCGLTLLLLLCGAAHAGPAAPTATINAAPTTGIAPYSTTLTWSSTGASACTASGAWTGAKGASGSAVVTVTANSTYTINCPGTAGAWADLTWTPPTFNVDGTPLTDLANYNVFVATTSAGVATATPVQVAAPASAYTVTGLTSGTRYFGIQACNVGGYCSVMSAIVNKVVQVPTATASVSVTVTTIPNPPVITTVGGSVWEIRPNGSLRNAGTISAGKPCLGNAPARGTDLYLINRADAYLKPGAKTGATLIAQCVAA